MQTLRASLIVGVDGIPLTPVVAKDLVSLAKDATVSKEATLQTIAKEATLQDIKTALQALPRPSTKIRRVTISLTNALADSAVDIGTLTHVHAVTVADLTGAQIPTVKFNGTGESAIPLGKGEVRDLLDATTLHVSCAAGGGSLVLELHGR